METEPITLKVEPEAARAFRESSTEEQDQLGLEVSFWLKRKDRGRPTPEDKARFLAVVDQIGASAQAKGLTPEILESLLNEK